MNETTEDKTADDVADRLDGVVSCEQWEMAAEMCADDVAYFYMDSRPRLALLMNDTFHYASADAEGVEWGELEEVYAVWKKDNWKGLVRWAAKKRGCKPLPQIQAQLDS